MGNVLNLGIGYCKRVPTSIGIRVTGGHMSVLMPVGTAMPATARRVYATTEDNQGLLAIEVFRGENAMVANNHRVGRFILAGIPRAPAGVTKVAITLALDHNGMLHVTATEETTRRRMRVAIGVNDVEPELALARALALDNRGRVTDAVEILAGVVADAPDSKRYQSRLAYLCGRLAEASGELDEAIQHYRDALRADPDNVIARSSLAKRLAPES